MHTSRYLISIGSFVSIKITDLAVGGIFIGHCGTRQDNLQSAHELKQIKCCLLLDGFCISLCTQISISLQIRSEYLMLPK